MKILGWSMLGSLVLGSSAVMAEVWDNADPIPPEGWLESNWFGEFIPYGGGRGDGWLFHAKHGDLYATGADENDVWLYDAGIGWFWTSASAPHYFFVWNGGQWVFFDERSGEGGGPRWFNLLSEGRWVTGAELQAGTAFLGGGASGSGDSGDSGDSGGSGGSDGGSDGGSGGSGGSDDGSGGGSGGGSGEGSGGDLMTDTSPLAPDSLVGVTFFTGEDSEAAANAKVGFSVDESTTYAIGDDFFGVGSGIIWSNSYDLTDLGDNVLRLRLPENTSSGPDMFHLTFGTETTGEYVRYALDDTSTVLQSGFFELAATGPMPASIEGKFMWTGDDETEANRRLGGFRFPNSRDYEVEVFGGIIAMGRYFYAPRTGNRGRAILDDGRLEMNFQSNGSEGLYWRYNGAGELESTGYFIMENES